MTPSWHVTRVWQLWHITQSVTTWQSNESPCYVTMLSRLWHRDGGHYWPDYAVRLSSPVTPVTGSKRAYFLPPLSTPFHQPQLSPGQTLVTTLSSLWALHMANIILSLDIMSSLLRPQFPHKSFRWLPDSCVSLCLADVSVFCVGCWHLSPDKLISCSHVCDTWQMGHDKHDVTWLEFMRRYCVMSGHVSAQCLACLAPAGLLLTPRVTATLLNNNLRNLDFHPWLLMMV